MTIGLTNDDLRRVDEFLSTLGLSSSPLTARPIGDGHSNLTYLLSDGRRQVVLRRPPPPPVPPGAHDVLREARIIAALAGTKVPTAAVLATAEADELLDVPCYFMSYVDGPVVTTATPEPLANPVDRRRIGETLIDILAELHAVDWQAPGLARIGRPEGFNARHLRRIGRLIAAADGSLPAEFADVHAWLAERVPAESGASLVHNDFRIGNMILGPDAPARIAAVLDWELATLGDPLLDLGYFLASYPVEGEPLVPTAELGTAVLEDGYPTRDELAERYTATTGRDLSGLNWYTALAQWKLAVLYEYSRRRGEDPYYADPALVRSFLGAARRVAGL